jgi:DNA (cytosine-5)-methyltransferase 1
MVKLIEEGRAPRVMVLENVCGALTSHEGKDFVAIADAVAEAGYKFGAIVVDAAEFVPHSRPRLFIIAVSQNITIPDELTSEFSDPKRHTKALIAAHGRIKGLARDKWVWWKTPKPPKRKKDFVDLIEDEPESVKWHTKDETARLLNMMSAVNRRKVEEAKKDGKLHVGAIYKRTRLENGNKVQRAEVRFDNVAGCLRTSTGGSSRQLILVVKGNEVSSRLISSRETARLMGLPETYILPKNYNEAYHLTGDGVVVPVVRYLAESILEPVLDAVSLKKRATA